MKFLSIAILFLASGCQSHLVNKEYLHASENKEDAGLGDSKTISCQSNNLQLLPIIISTEVLSNSIFWLPIIPTPWNNREYREMLRVEMAGGDDLRECKENDVSLIINEHTLVSNFAFIVKHHGEAPKCIYEFSLDGFDLTTVKTSKILINDTLNCQRSNINLYLRRKTVYENYFQPW